MVGIYYNLCILNLKPNDLPTKHVFLFISAVKLYGKNVFTHYIIIYEHAV